MFPVSLKYVPADVTTPVPGFRAVGRFVWGLLGKPAHCIRVRIGERVMNEEGEVGEREEEKVCERAAEALARVGRVQRLNLGVREKGGFVEAWKKNRR